MLVKRVTEHVVTPQRRWDVFASGPGLALDASSSKLFHGEQAYFRCHGRHAVASRHRSSHRCDASRAHSSAARALAARVRGKAETYSYITKCTCLREVDFTNSITRDVLIACIPDLDIRRELLGTNAVLERAVNDVISLVESNGRMN